MQYFVGEEPTTAVPSIRQSRGKHASKMWEMQGAFLERHERGIRMTCLPKWAPWSKVVARWCGTSLSYPSRESRLLSALLRVPCPGVHAGNQMRHVLGTHIPIFSWILCKKHVLVLNRGRTPRTAGRRLAREFLVSVAVSPDVRLLLFGSEFSVADW